MRRPASGRRGPGGRRRRFRSFAVRVLDAIGPEAKAAVPALTGFRRQAARHAIRHRGRLGEDRCGGGGCPAALTGALATRTARFGVLPPRPWERLAREPRAIPALGKLLERWSQQQAAEAAGNTGPKPNPTSSASLFVEVREWAGCRVGALALNRIDPEDKGGRPVPHRAAEGQGLGDSAAMRRRPGRHRCGGEGCLASLVKLLGERNADNGRAAAVALGQMGPAKAAVPWRYPTIRPRSRRLVCRRRRPGKDGPAAVPAFTQLLGHNNRLVRYDAARALGKIGPAAKSAVPALTKLFKDRENKVREAAVRP